ncbi:unnamed protein product [Angiostrongylus costaricensis]|uniref:Reverse transcriptase domain-containing protein n=1 Tax=Angiostrongylus costaricensis TaxID=334426 RepID=A0A0R3PJS0_ANGCS|nr:unnamed protein product [Angiostrongylus costaricensis]
MEDLLAPARVTRQSAGLQAVQAILLRRNSLHIELGKGDTISPKLFTATLQNVMRTLKWDKMGVKIGDRQFRHLRFADDIVIITLNIRQSERMLADFDNAYGKIGLRQNFTKTMFMRNGFLSYASLNARLLEDLLAPARVTRRSVDRSDVEKLRNKFKNARL